MKIATIITRNVSPKLYDWSHEGCRFLGSLDGEELWVTPRGEYLRVLSPEESQYGTLGTLAPEGTPYAFAAKLAKLGRSPHAYVVIEGDSLD